MQPELVANGMNASVEDQEAGRSNSADAKLWVRKKFLSAPAICRSTPLSLTNDRCNLMV